MDVLAEHPEERPAPPRPGRLSRIPMIALAATSGIVLALLLMPTTRWIVWRQAGLQTQSASSISSTLQDLGIKDTPQDRQQPYDVAAEDTRVADLCGRDDWQLQLAAAMRRYQSHPRPATAAGQAAPTHAPSRGDEIRKLKDRFGNKASLYANAIRLDTQARFVKVHRPVEEEVFNQAGKVEDLARYHVPDPAELTQFLDDCQAGERLEPQNGYFPMMRAAALLEEKRDSEALPALHRAAECTQWQPHYADEAEGVWRLNMLTRGDRSAIHRMAVQAAIMFPELALMRQAARVVLGMAIEAELAGRKDEGLRIRMDVARCGALMRAEAPSAIGNLVGIAITAMASGRPGGAVVLKRSGARIAPGQKTNRLVAYLRSQGANREADWYLSEINAGMQAKGVVLAGLNNSPASLWSIRRLALLWMGGIVLFGNAFWLTALGVVGAVYLRRWRARLAAGIVREDMFVLLMGAACVLMAISLIAWGQGQMAYSYAQSVASLGVAYGTPVNTLPSDPGPLRVVAMGMLLILPGLLAALALIVGAVRKRSVVVEIARAFRAVGLVVAVFLMGGYAVVAVQTSRREAEMNTALSGIIQHEGRYAAKATGGAWPALKHD